MDAIEFVKQNGIEKAKQIVDLFPMSTLISVNGIGVSISNLKQVVDAFDLVERKGGVEISNEILETWAFMLAVKAKVGKSAELLADDYDVLKHALDLVEKCNES